MRNSELKKMISEYLEIKNRLKKRYLDSSKLSHRAKEIEHRYFHETGRILKSDLDKLR